MPTYEFTCPNGHDFEKFFRTISSGQSELPCPVCGAMATRKISAGAGLMFKGSGFYITDYGKDGKKDQNSARNSTSNGESSSASAGESGNAASAGGSDSGSQSKPSESKASDPKSSSTEPKPSSATPPAPKPAEPKASAPKRSNSSE
jgi:putative FmdB family regulatory protein